MPIITNPIKNQIKALSVRLSNACVRLCCMAYPSPPANTLNVISATINSLICLLMHQKIRHLPPNQALHAKGALSNSA
ncbi:hypothetical protein [Hyphomicrobium sp. D-2]|uniref:hypothetical protein n=1 Tax=Hyphomicrobium sp. D-2 TaxID=3041621 RepID=UPI00245753A0|nr:hypothetical protein [Hyphomicrobium sp. D-2]MDH4982348.1 hypothetical protein [Hyphomicrobium sp. D-2]